MKLKEITIKPQNTYAAEFFESVAGQPEGKYFRYEQPTTNNLIRSAAQTFSAKLGKKFSIHTVREGEAAVFAVGWTSKERKPRTKKPKQSEPAEILFAGNVIVGDPETTDYELGGSGSDLELAV